MIRASGYQVFAATLLFQLGTTLSYLLFSGVEVIFRLASLLLPVVFFFFILEFILPLGFLMVTWVRKKWLPL